ncbi:MAG: AAA family ATPase [Deltaproteobacteria bacterium]|nr:AAA family ATPase [Deltaproteobacteria bacterium]
MTTAFCLWFYGPAGSGKSTLGRLITASILKGHPATQLLDEDEIAACVSALRPVPSYLTETTARLAFFMTKLLMSHGITVVVASSAPPPDRQVGTWNDQTANRPPMIAVALECPEDTRMARLKIKAEPPVADRGPELPVDESIDIGNLNRSDLIIRTAEEWPDQSRDRILRGLETLGIITPHQGEGYTDEEKTVLEHQLQDLGYI